VEQRTQVGRSNSQPDQTGILLTRVFRAPRSRVWKEWTEPAAFADWFGGTQADIPIETVSMDVREGGEWRATMFVGPDRREIQWCGEYRDVVEPKLLVLTFCDRPDNDCELMTVVLTEPEEGWTEMLVRQRGGMTPEEYERARSGLVSFLDRMAQRLET